jgi:hypothetical protein
MLCRDFMLKMCDGKTLDLREWIGVKREEEHCWVGLGFEGFQ